MPDAARTGKPGSGRDRQDDGTILKFSGIALMIAAFAGAALLAIVNDGSIPRWAPGALAAALGVPGAALYRRGRKHFAVSARELLERDPRPPVIYLRSFQADKEAAAAVTSPVLAGPFALLHPIETWSRLFETFDSRTEEELLVEALGQVGPVVAIGKPGEKLPELGAARTYVSDAEWQTTVRDLFGRAALAVLRIGQTPGFYWEVEHSAKSLDPRRLVLLVPTFSRKQYDAFRKGASAHFPRPLPEYGTSLVRSVLAGGRLGSVGGLVYFKRDWTAVYVDLTRVKWPWKHSLRFLGRRTILNVLDWALQPVYRQLGVTWTPPPARWGIIVLKLIPGIVVTGIVVVLAYITLTNQW